MYFSGPREWFDEGSLMNGTYRDLDAMITDVDVLMLLRIQHERHDEKMKLTPQDYLKNMVLPKSVSKNETKCHHHASCTNQQRGRNRQ